MNPTSPKTRPRDRSPQRLSHQSPSRPGVTLVELLVVVAVLVILLAVAIPLIKPALEGRKVREASRQINAYCAAAQARAAARGRSVGVWLQREDAVPDHTLQLFMAETPPPYSGDTTTARAVLSDGNSDGYAETAQLTFADQLGSLGVAAGDRIRFNYSGPLYTIASVTASPPTVIFAHPNMPRPVPTSAAGVPFEIFRQPRRTSAAPLELPKAICVELGASGTGLTGAELGGASGPVAIMFSPNGGVERVYANNLSIEPQGKLHLLIGQHDKDAAGNLADQGNLWVSINHINGVVSSTNNLGGALSAAREFAQKGEALGGR